MMRLGIVEMLERRATPLTVIDAVTASQQVDHTVAIDAPPPRNVAESVVFFRPFGFQQGFGLAVAALLAKVATDRIAAAVPNHGSRMETQRPAALHDAPADIDVVAGHAVCDIKATDGQQVLATEGHVAAGNVLSGIIGEQDMQWATR